MLRGRAVEWAIAALLFAALATYATVLVLRTARAGLEHLRAEVTQEQPGR